MTPIDPKLLHKALMDLAVIPSDQLDDALKESVDTNKQFEAILLDRELISDENLGKTIADLLGVPFIMLGSMLVPKEILTIIPQVVAEKQHVIAFQKGKDGLHVAMSDPSDLQIRSFIEKKSGIPLVIYHATLRDIERALSLYTNDAKSIFDELIKESADTTSETSIIKLVDTMLSFAYDNRSSDVHVEPYEDKTIIRFRIDGILHDIVTLPKTLHDQIMTRIKVLSKLRTDEHQAAQDGKLQFRKGDDTVDVRVSIVPVVEGEKAVLRLLSEKSRQYTLTDLGLTPPDLVKVETAFRKPYGMILATGPTGSGKTTTLYGILKKLNTRNVNIMTIEDPVEYDIEGINQIQVNPKTNLTFAAGLRSIVRQDPNIILVGEIRDPETADIAINSAMTGHLVLSTLHTNDAATTFPRFFDFHVEPFLVASTINVIVAQRLVRKICMKCRISKTIHMNSMEHLFSKNLYDKYFSGKTELMVYEGKGCPVCHNTGYEGRVGIFEVMIINDAIREAIIEKKDAGVIAKLAGDGGMTTMLEDGINKVQQGITTLEEVMRVTKE